VLIGEAQVSGLNIASKLSVGHASAWQSRRARGLHCPKKKEADNQRCKVA